MDIPQSEIREICLRYKYAADRSAQIEIEAQLYDTSRKHIVAILKENAGKYGITGEITWKRRTFLSHMTREEQRRLRETFRPKVRQMYDKGIPYKQIAEELGITYYLVYDYVRGTKHSGGGK
jgi:DNA invertase Pin-like site-specific DNA recombinase